MALRRDASTSCALRRTPIAGFSTTHSVRSPVSANVDLKYLKTSGLDDYNSPKELAETILNACLSDQFWSGLVKSPFDEAAALADPNQQAEKLSITTQFFLAEVNTFCYAQKKSAADFGKVLESDSSEQLRIGLISTVQNAFKDNLRVEDALINFINNNQQAFGLNERISTDDAKKIIERSTAEYNTVKDGPHMDEFILFMPDASGDFVNHKNRISFDFYQFAEEYKDQLLNEQNRSFVEKQLELFSKRPTAENRLPPKNDIEQTSISFGFETMMSSNPSQLVTSLANDKNIDKLDQALIKKIIQHPKWDELRKAANALKQQHPKLYNNFYKKFSSESILAVIKEFQKTALPPSFNLNIKAENGNSALLAAIKNKDTETIKFLLENGADSTITNNSGENPLMLAVKENDLTLVNSILPTVDKATLITSLAYISKSNLPPKEKKQFSNQIFNKIGEGAPGSVIKALRFLASFKLTAGIATFILAKGLDKKNNPNLYTKPSVTTLNESAKQHHSSSQTIISALSKGSTLQTDIAQQLVKNKEKEKQSENLKSQSLDNQLNENQENKESTSLTP